MGLGSGIQDPGSEIRDPRTWIRKKPIPDPGSRGQTGTGSRIPDPQHCISDIGNYPSIDRTWETLKFLQRFPCFLKRNFCLFFFREKSNEKRFSPTLLYLHPRQSHNDLPHLHLPPPQLCLAVAAAAAVAVVEDETWPHIPQW